MAAFENTSGSVASRASWWGLVLFSLALLAAPSHHSAIAQFVVTNEGGAAKQATPPMVEYLPRPSDAEIKILAALEQPTQFDFDDMPLSDAIAFIKDKHGIEIQLDQKALEDAGVGTDTPINAHIQNVSLRSALRLLLHTYELRFVVEDEVLLITTSDRASNLLETRIYPVGDLAGAKEYDTLVEAITRNVAMQTWDDVGGPGSISPVAPSQALVVSQTQDIQDKVLQLLRSLRAAQKLAAPTKVSQVSEVKATK